MDNIQELRAEVDKSDGLLKIDMATLKRIKGAGRLGRVVREEISRELEGQGMGHIPADLPPNQEDEVRLYVLGSAIADVVRAVLEPSDRGDEALRAVGNNEAAEIVKQVRALVCE